jgi:hypothetical protein
MSSASNHSSLAFIHSRVDGMYFRSNCHAEPLRIWQLHQWVAHFHSGRSIRSLSTATIRKEETGEVRGGAVEKVVDQESSEAPSNS